LSKIREVVVDRCSCKKDVIVALFVAALISCGAPSADHPPEQSRSAGSCSPKTQRIPVNDFVYDISVGDDAVWLLVGDERDNYYIRSIDLRALSLTDVRVLVGGPETAVFDVEAGEGAVWVPVFKSPPTKDANIGRLLRIDPRNGTIVSRITIGKRSLSATAGEGYVWLTYDTDDADGEVLLVDPRTEKVSETIAVGRIRSEVMLSDGGAWIVTGEDGNRLIRIDLATHRTRTVLSDRASFAVADGAVWFVDEGGIGRYDLVSHETGSARYYSAVGPYKVNAGLGAVWLSRPIEQRQQALPAETSSGTGPGSGPAFPQRHLRSYRVGIERLDPASMKPISDTILLDPGAEPLRGAAFGADAFWVPSRQNVLHVSLRC
jgi:hypothetical protein